jgi:hypothetical protein
MDAVVKKCLRPSWSGVDTTCAGAARESGPYRGRMFQVIQSVSGGMFEGLSWIKYSVENFW